MSTPPVDRKARTVPPEPAPTEPGEAEPQAVPAAAPIYLKPVISAKGVALPPPASTPTAALEPAVVAPPTGAGEPPATLAVATPPGKEGPMQVVMAAEVLRRVKRTRQAVSLVSQVVIRAYDEEALHAEVCRHLVGFGGYLMAWIGLADEDDPGHAIRPVAHEGLEANFLGALRITWNNDLNSTSPTSLAMQEQRPQVARNILKEPRYAVLRKEAQLFGYTATCALPLQFAQYGLGVLTIHAMEPDAFNAEEVSLLRELANDLAAGVIGLRERGKRRILEQQLAAVVDAADNAIIGTTLDGTITQWNAGATRMFGHSRNEALGTRMDDLIVPTDHAEEEARIRRAVAGGEHPPRYETVRVCKEDKLIHTSVTVTPILAGDGKVVGMTAIEHDITVERATNSAKRARALEDAEVMRLKEIEAVRKTFLSAASHELKTPLTPLLIHVEAMRDAPELTPQTISAHLSVIHRNVVRLANLVNDMLESSRLETGRFKLDVVDFPIAVAIESAIEGLLESATSQGIALQPGPLARVLVQGDRHRVDQVLHNLLGNAISFTPKGGRITVSSRPEDGKVVVRVADTGIGLTADQLAKLFQPFSRAHEGSGSAPKGTGLGLFISKGIIEQHGGRIWAESPGPGKGSTFCFSLPMAVGQSVGQNGAGPA
jgi:PAS domain S-box-containing protein